jgi:RNA polymerase sigma-70 factor (ECF subfamily)
MSTDRSDSEQPADADLVRRVQAGDRTAFDQLVRRHQRRATAIAFRLLGNSQDALEVTQDAFLKGFMSIQTLENPAAFVGWQMRIVSNLSLNYRRGSRRKQSLPLDETLVEETPGRSGMENPAQRLAGGEMEAEIRQAVEKLPEKQRLAIVLFTLEQMPQKDVAEAMDCSVEAVKWHVFQGRKKLKETLGKYL